ncbi:dimethyladenosine transferase 2, mitochondrial isoform 2-T2 [Aulostomus maculatus]
MSTQIGRLLEMVLRSTCCQTVRNRSCLRKAVLVPVGPSGLSPPWAPVLHRRAYSLDSLSSGPDRSTYGAGSQQSGPEKTTPSSAISHRNLSALAVQGQHHPRCLYDYLDLGEVEENVRLAKACPKKRHYIVDPELAKVVTQHLAPDPQDTKTIIFECNPGPGVLTKTLLNAGAQRLVALQGEKSFLKDLQLEGHLDGQLEVVHCNFFQLDPLGFGTVKPPTMFTEKLFTDLGISEANWTDDIPVKVVGIAPLHNERCFLLKLVYALFERCHVFRYGRIELNLFISERLYQSLTARPGQMKMYKPLAVLWQMSCDIELLHKVPWESLALYSKGKIPASKGRLPNDHLCLVRLRPRADLFSSGLTPSNAATLLMIVKQCLIRTKGKIIEKLNGWSPDSGSKLLSELGMSEDILTGQLHPGDYLRLFQQLDKSPDFKHSWLYVERLENTETKGWA